VTESADKVSLQAPVSGRVQGVFYRMFVYKEATALGLRGEVRNLPDGRVEVRAEGERARLEPLVERLKAGPRGADVAEVAVEWLDYSHEYDEFRIAYD
jgi:acylphosphatase